MYRKDYILRMVEMLGELIAALLGLIKKGDFSRASETLEKAYTNFLHEDAAFFRAIPKEKITQILIEEHNYTHSHLEILSELFAMEAELQYALRNYPACIEFSEKTLLLMEFIEKESKDYSLVRREKISAIKNRLGKLKA